MSASPANVSVFRLSQTQKRSEMGCLGADTFGLISKPRFKVLLMICGLLSCLPSWAVEQKFEWVPELIEQEDTEEKLENWNLGFELGYRISGVHRWHYGTTTGAVDGAGGVFDVEFSTPEGLKLKSADFVVPLASLRTGNSTRDLHMRAD
ncbi:MAG: YceI family protein, partial [Bdellovibrionota bacterium]